MNSSLDRMVLFFLAMLSCLNTAPSSYAAEPASSEFECRRASAPIALDGRADEAAWKTAAAIDGFIANPAKGGAAGPPKTATRARLLWDDENLYFFADMDDADLYADVQEQDGATWTNDVFELFFKPSDERLGYYEFEVSAANVHMEMFLPSRGSGGYQRWARERKFGWETKTALRGTLNDWQDRDRGWSVEGRIPWQDLAPTGGRPAAGDRWKFILTRYDYSIDNEAPELSRLASLKIANFHYYEEYSTLKFVGAKP